MRAGEIKPMDSIDALGFVVGHVNGCGKSHEGDVNMAIERGRKL